MKLGINLNDISYYDNNKPFSNLVKGSNKWDISVNTASISISKNGTVAIEKATLFNEQIPAEAIEYLKSNKITYELSSDKSPRLLVATNVEGGNYIVSYSGSAILSYKKNVIFSGQTIFVEPNSSIDLKVLFLRGNLTNLEVIHESKVGTKFNPSWLAKVAPFSTFRFMDWLKTNNSTASEWANRTTTDHQSYFNKDIPIEEICLLCNQLNINPWINIPHLATNDYAIKLSETITRLLNPDLKVFIEYSNEVWNGAFKQNRYACDQGLKLGGRPSDFYTLRASQLIGACKIVLGDRAIGVLGTQFANVGWLKNCSKLKLVKKAKRGNSLKEAGFDVIATGPYIGYRLGHKLFINPLLALPTTELVDAIFKQLLVGGIIAARSEMTLFEEFLIKNVEFSKELGLPLIAYEGGQHLIGNTPDLKNNAALTNAFHVANRDERMGLVYTVLLSLWNKYNSENPFCLFNDVRSHNKSGAWGLWENLMEETPKSKAVLDFLAK